MARHRMCSSFLFGLILCKFYNKIMETKQIFKQSLSYDVASGSEITPCNKIDKPLVVYRFMGNIMTSITTLRTK